MASPAVLLAVRGQILAGRRVGAAGEDQATQLGGAEGVHAAAAVGGRHALEHGRGEARRAVRAAGGGERGGEQRHGRRVAGRRDDVGRRDAVGRGAEDLRQEVGLEGRRVVGAAGRRVRHDAAVRQRAPVGVRDGVRQDGPGGERAGGQRELRGHAVRVGALVFAGSATITPPWASTMFITAAGRRAVPARSQVHDHSSIRRAGRGSARNAARSRGEVRLWRPGLTRHSRRHAAFSLAAP